MSAPRQAQGVVHEGTSRVGDWSSVADTHPPEAMPLPIPFRLRSAGTLADLPFFLPLLAASVLVGFRESLSLPYVTLFAVERGRMDPLAVGFFLTVRAAGAIAISMVFGAWFDRRPSLRPLLLALAAGSLGFVLLTTTTNFWLLCVIAAVPLGMGASAFPLLFAVAKVQGAGADPLMVARGITLLRASFSLAWGIGPAIGALVMGDDHYNALFWVSAAFSVAALLPLTMQRTGAAPMERTTAVPSRLGAPVALAAGSLILYSMALGMGAVALPIVITSDFLGSKAQVGLAASVCALLEVPVMTAIAVRPSSLVGFKAMAFGFVAFALYFAVAAVAPSAGALVGAQVLRAVGIGFVSCIGIGYLQDLMPNRVGAASVLFSNTSQIGQLLAGIAAGAWAQVWNYHSLFWPCAAMTLIGMGCLALGHRLQPRG